MYQNSLTAVSSHKDQMHFNGRHYNKKAAIPRTYAAWKFRNNLWCERYAMACLKIQYLSSLWQSGGNVLEGIHSALNKWFPWLRLEGGGLARAMAFNIVQTFKNNLSKARLIQAKGIKANDDSKLKWSDDWIDGLVSLLAAGEDMKELDPNNPKLPQYNNKNHCILYSPEAVNAHKQQQQCMYK